MRDAMTTATVSHPPWLVVSVAGQVDSDTAGALRERLRTLMLEGHVDLMLDISGVTFLDSAGLGVLVGAQKLARVFRGSFELVGAGPAVLRLLSLTALDRVLRHHATLADARAAHGLTP